MAQVYASLIEEHAICPKTGEAWSIQEVPARLRESVLSILKEDGFVE